VLKVVANDCGGCGIYVWWVLLVLVVVVNGGGCGLYVYWVLLVVVNGAGWLWIYTWGCCYCCWLWWWLVVVVNGGCGIDM